MPISTTNASTAWAPNTQYFQPAEVIGESLIMTASTVAGTIEGDDVTMSVAYVSDDTAQFTNEGDTIPESAPALDEVVVHTGKLTQLVRVSREQYAQQSTAANLAASVQRAIRKASDIAFLAQAAPAAPAVRPPAGILNLTGLQAAAAAVTTNLDPLVDLLAALETNGATPTLIIVDPIGWSKLAKIKTTTGSAVPLLGAGTEATERRLLGLPVTVTPAMPSGTGLVIDKTEIVSVAGRIEVATSDQAYFVNDSIAIRATFRFGATVVHPDRIGTFTIATA